MTLHRTEEETDEKLHRMEEAEEKIAPNGRRDR